VTATRAVWVLGMHRSGTSLVAGVLRLLGADLGPRDGMLLADALDNPRGYWEQRAVVDVNNELLARLSGSSSTPPALQPGWERRPDLDDLRERAGDILSRFDPACVWAVKDPRLSLTLPFWRPLVDESAAVISLRAPRDVAASLARRDPGGPMSRRAWTQVWRRYTEAALANAAGLPSRTLFYDDWFADRDGQMRALSGLLEELGHHAGGAAQAAVDDFVATKLRHHASSLEEAAEDPDSEPEARELYARLRAAAERPVDAPPERPGGATARRFGTPRTSVQMAAYNPVRAQLIAAVESVLGQTVGDLELIVVDDGSDEPVEEMLADHADERLRIVRHGSNRGLSAARNTALRLARAPLVSHLDSDDAWEPDYLEHVLPVFDDQRVGLAYTNAAIVGHPEGHHVYIFDPDPHPIDHFPKIAEQNPVPLLTATARTQAVRDAGGYARWLRGTQDYYLWCRLAAAGWRFVFIDRQLARYRWPSDDRSLSHDRRRVELDELRMWIGFVLRHPLIPGPRRQVRVRLRREVERLRFGR
jgi:hypothetical protein